MRTAAVSLALTTSLVFNAPFAFAGDTEKKAAEAFAQAYAQEQIKYQLGQFLNTNPQIVFSANPQIGTQSMQFLSQAMSVYTLVTAKTDKQRAFSAATLIISPEPTTAAILIAIQVADALITMKHQKDLAKIYEQTAAIRAATIEIYKKLAIEDFKSQTNIAARFGDALDKIEELQNKMVGSKLYEVFQKSAAEKQIDPEDVETTLRDLAALKAELYELDIATLLISATLKPEMLGLNASYIEDCRATNERFDSLRQNLEAIETSFYYFFGSLKTEELKAQVRKDLMPYATVLRTYKQCVSLVNAAMTETFLSGQNETSREVEYCQKRFANGSRK